MITELVPLLLPRLENLLVMTRAASVARASPAVVACAGGRGLTGSELGGFFARAAEQYYLRFECLVNDLHQNLVIERFCKEGKCSCVERGLAQ